MAELDGLETSALRAVGQRLRARDGAALRTPLEVWACRPATPLSLVASVYDRAVAEGCTTVGELLTRAGLHRRLAEDPQGQAIVDRLATDLARFVDETPTLDDTEGGGGELRPQMDGLELERWAVARGIAGLLDAPARRTLEGALAGRSESWLWFESARGVSMRRVITAQTARSRAWPSRTAAPLVAQEAAIDALREAAATAAVAIREEAEQSRLARQAPTTPRLLAFEERLLLVRESLRATLAPRPRALVEGHLSLDPDAGSLLWVERGKPYCSAKPRQEVRIPLTGGLPTPTCDCVGPFAGVCPVALSAVDAALDALVAPDRRVLARRIERALGDARVGTPEPPPPDPTPEAPQDLGSLAWRLHADPVLGLRLDAILPSDDGGPPRGVSLRALRERGESCPLPADRRATERLVGRAATGPRLGLADRASVHRAIAALVGHPRVLGQEPDGRLRPLRVEREDLTLRWSAGIGGRIEVVALLGETRLNPPRLARLATSRSAGGLLITLEGERCIVTSVAPGALQLLGMLGQEQLDEQGADALLARLPAFSRLLPVSLDPSLRGAEVPADSQPVIRLEIATNGALRVQVRVRPLRGGQVLLPGDGPVEVYGAEAGRRVFAHRDLARETERAELAVPQLPPAAADEGWEVQLGDPDESLELIERLQQGSDASVEWTGDERRRVIGSAGLRALRVSVRSLEEWLGGRDTSSATRFALDGALTIDGREVALRDLFAAVRDGRRYVQADEAGWVRLEDGLLDGLTRAAAGLYSEGDVLVVTPVHAAALAGLSEGGASFEAPDRFMSLLDDIRAALQLDPPLPEGFCGELRDYQRDGFRWMVRLAAWTDGGCLADDMGLGKTIQALALLMHRAPRGPALVVAPTSVGFNWLREADRFAPPLKTTLYRGHERRVALSELGPGDVVVTSYELLLRDKASLGAVAWSTLVLDEAQAIKNPRARRSVAAAALQAEFRIALTGTPMENRLGELWSVFRALNAGLLGGAEQFRQRYALPIERDRDKGRQAALSALIRPFVLRRVKEEVARELPERTEIEVPVTLSGKERELYDALRRAAIDELTASVTAPSQRRLQALAALTRLRQAACHPRLVDEASTLPSSKLTRLREIVEELRQEGHRALIFSQFVRHLALVREMLDADGVTYRYLDGATPERSRRQEVDAFQDGEGDVFLISLRAGGTGLNLTAATYVIHLDPWWNPAVEDQATDRAHRIGQTRPVTVFRLVAQDTIEESILALHDHKRSLVAGVLAGTADGATLGVEDILELLGWDGG